MGKRKGKSVRKNGHVGAGPGGEEPEELSRAPHSFVVHRGKTGKYVQELAKDFRQVMEPFTASNIKVRPKNVIKDFVHVAGLLKVSHLAMFTKTALGPYLKLGRFPRGPTITFRVESYTLGRDVRSSLKRQVTYAKQYANHPLLIMNSFTSTDQDRSMQLVESMFQNMFPSINPTKVKVNTIRRCVLLNYNKDTKTIDFRHYTIKVVPVGLNRGVKKLVTSRIPNMGRCADVAEFLQKGGAGLSESEGEEDEASHVTAPQGVSVRGVVGGSTSSVRLVELGPRMTLKMVKIEEGLLDGEVLHHEFVEKTDEEKKAIKEKREKAKREKEKRKRDQEKNVKKKEREKEDNKAKSLDGMKKKEDKEKSWQGEKIAEFKKEQAELGEAVETEKYESSDDDEAYYEKEVGHKPDKDLFSGSIKTKGVDLGKRWNKKKPESGGKPFRGREEKGGKKFEGRGKDRGDKKFEGRGKDRGDKKKRQRHVFNSEGVGPDYKKSDGGMGKGKLRGVKGGKVVKNKGKGKKGKR